MKKLRRHFRVAPLVIPQRAQTTAQNLQGIVAEKDLKGKRNLEGEVPAGFRVPTLRQASSRLRPAERGQPGRKSFRPRSSGAVLLA